MKSGLRLFVGAVCLLLAGGGAWLTTSGEGTWAASDPVPGCPGGIFTQKAVVFNALTLCASHKVPLEKLHHAANVAAQWIDNNQDGFADEPRVLEALKSRPAFVYMTEKGMNAVGMMRVFSAQEGMGAVGQDLGAHETNPSEGRDASQEEIHHIVMNAGWIPAFPEVFSDDPARQSVLFQQWERAEQNGFYAYDDPTCDAACKVTEFVYLATAAYLGSAADLENDEMRIKTREALKKNLPDLVALFESDAYVYPGFIWPTGVYAHQDHIQLIDARRR